MQNKSLELYQNKLIKNKIFHILIKEYNGLSKPSVFEDTEYGSFVGYFNDVRKGKKNHPERSRKKLNENRFNNASIRLTKKFNYLILIEYEGQYKAAKVYDKEFDEILVGTYDSISQSGTVNNSLRSKQRKKNSYACPARKEKTKKTSLERYGVTCSLQSPEALLKAKDTNIRKYGVEYPMRSKQVRDKLKQTHIERYGVDNYAKTKEYREKFIKTNRDRYGMDHYTQTDEFKKYYEELMMERYGVTHNFYLPDFKEKRLKTWLKNYKTDHPQKSLIVRNQAKQTNLKKYGTESPSQNKIIKQKIRFTAINNGNIHSYNGYTTSDFEKETGLNNPAACYYFRQSKLYNIHPLKLYQDCKTCLERPIYFLLKDLNIEFTYNKGLPEAKTKYRPDFLILSLKLIIECDGEYWHLGNEEKDLERQKFIESYGYKVIRFTGKQIQKQWELVKNTIKEEIGFN